MWTLPSCSEDEVVKRRVITCLNGAKNGTGLDDETAADDADDFQGSDACATIVFFALDDDFAGRRDHGIVDDDASCDQGTRSERTVRGSVKVYRLGRVEPDVAPYV